MSVLALLEQTISIWTLLGSTMDPEARGSGREKPEGNQYAFLKENAKGEFFEVILCRITLFP